LKPLEVRKYLFDIAEACGLIQTFVGGKSFEDYTRIISFRNRLIHGYASVADEIVWGVVEANLRKLKNEVEVLLNED
jgi:uncharacterized protein with HEPN domain